MLTTNVVARRVATRNIYDCWSGVTIPHGRTYTDRLGAYRRRIRHFIPRSDAETNRAMSRFEHDEPSALPPPDAHKCGECDAECDCGCVYATDCTGCTRCVGEEEYEC